MMIERIRREHGYMIRLLAILKSKAAKLKDDQTISYSLVRDIVDYLANHSEKVHHPKEDILYRYFLTHYGQQFEISNLESEHQQLSQKTHDFVDVVDMILKDAVIPQDLFLGLLEEFMLAQKRHLEVEESSILPLIKRTFNEDDWKAVEALWNVNEDDPLFGDQIADKYQQLAKRMAQQDIECV
ncbi:hemerythrin domain-containing protein [Vibrio sp. 10N.261.55.A7]|uniref:hemerythrin domain-containing protein n=1 Tax=Vibrio sp. 10N.261.55.A7 TaxID=1880851 RepID=UPI000C81D2B8|nr:hemerythrin domain-containing protein [Vibrio sp. 10N.261.55.A7]PMJ92551.1 cation-binding protein [Vibrio sp. 10N.261.55.A7]